METCIVVRRVSEESGIACEMQEGRDLWWDEAVAGVSADCPCEEMDAEDPLFVLYTSGSTGSRRGFFTRPPATWFIRRLRTSTFRLPRGGRLFCAADIGWITGHSYIVYGPLANGATTTMFESIPTYPNPDRYWQVIEKWKVNQFYTAPTAIRAIAAPGRNGRANTRCPVAYPWQRRRTD